MHDVLVYTFVQDRQFDPVGPGGGLHVDATLRAGQQDRYSAVAVDSHRDVQLAFPGEHLLAQHLLGRREVAVAAMEPGNNLLELLGRATDHHPPTLAAAALKDLGLGHEGVCSGGWEGSARVEGTTRQYDAGLPKELLRLVLTQSHNRQPVAAVSPACD